MRCDRTASTIAQIVRILPVLLLPTLLVGEVDAQNSEYSLQAFDEERDNDSFMPVETVDLFSGALLLRYTDIRLPGPNDFDLEVVRWST